MKKIGIIGAGTMGSGIAQVVAQSEYDVILRDINEEFIKRGLQNIEKNLSRSVKKDKISEEDKKKTLKNISSTTELSNLKTAEIIIEAVPENLELKTELFSELNSLCSEDTIFATNTSALSITEIAVSSGRPEKLIGIHFFNPVPVMDLVELIKSAITDDYTFNKAEEFVKSIGKSPVEVNESPGFIVNRILIPMINEAVYLFEESVASAEDIDTAMKLGANHPIGPLALADLIGLDVCLAIMDTLYEEFKDSKYRAAPLLRKKVRADQLGRKTGEGFYNY